MTIRQALEKANKQIQKKVDDALKNEVFAAVQKAELERIEHDVYDAGTPVKYARRGNWGGMADPENIVGSVKNGTLTVVNETEPNPGGCPDDHVTIDKELDWLIEYGHNDERKHYYYDHPRKWWYMKPRPFTADTIEDLRFFKDHIVALQDGLRRQGVKTAGGTW